MMNSFSLICTVGKIDDDGVELTFDINKHVYIPTDDGIDCVLDVEGKTMLSSPLSFVYSWKIWPEISIDLPTKYQQIQNHKLVLFARSVQICTP